MTAGHGNVSVITCSAMTFFIELLLLLGVVFHAVRTSRGVLCSLASVTEAARRLHEAGRATVSGLLAHVSVINSQGSAISLSREEIPNSSITTYTLNNASTCLVL